MTDPGSRVALGRLGFEFRFKKIWCDRQFRDEEPTQSLRDLNKTLAAHSADVGKQVSVMHGEWLRPLPAWLG